jgi:LPS-assembly protein
LSSKTLISACLLLAASHAVAVEPESCRTSLDGPLLDNPLSLLKPLDDPETIQLEAGGFEATLGAMPTAVMSGGVLLRRDDKVAGAETARYDPEQKALHLEGGVNYQDPGTRINSTSAEFGYVSGRIRFEGADFSLGGSKSRGAADAIEINQSGVLTLDGVEYTTCPPGSEDWLMQGKSIELDTRSGVGTARGMKLKFKGVPILYAPYLSFPIGDARKTGILTPEVGSSGRSGNEIRVPWYWNIAPNYDATITPRLLTSRGMQIATEFRYMTERNQGMVVADYLPDDDIIDRARHQFRFEHRTLFGNGWRNEIDLRDVSDSQYYEDLGNSLSISSITHLNRSIRFDYYSPNFSMLAQAQEYQTIDDAIAPELEPYRRLPQVLVNGSWKNRFGLRFGIDGEIVNFDHATDGMITGWRANASPMLDWDISKPGWFINPAIAFDYTHYELDDIPPGDETDPTRALPIASLDTGLILERSMTGSNRIQTIEPRIMYVHIPHRDQDHLPIFDTITPDINLVQLFRKNRYIGVDRIGDTDHLSVGITSRVLDISTGRELMSATIGQTRYFADRRVSLLDADAVARGAGTTTKSEARLQYRPASNKILNLAYRFRRDSLEQGDLSWSWPIATRWNFVGRYNFSFRDDEVLEQFFGLEYESCCWGLRLVSRRHISTRDGTRDSSFGLQLVLKGMTSVGTAADKLLERGILGYSADLR